jgi:tetratricopeptide (TPR) repeat protein
MDQGPTSPTNITAPEIQPEPELKPAKSRKARWIWLGILSVFLLAAIGVGLGYYSAIQLRLQKQNENTVIQSTTQYELGLQDLAEGRLEIARKRFEYVIQIDPNFPGAADKLAQVLVQLSLLKTPTQQPTPTLFMTPTPDVTGVDAKFQLAVTQLKNGEWDAVLGTVDAVRAENDTYKTVQLDGLVYMALRNRGIWKIQNALLEGGIYDLSLASTIAPIDREANNYRDWAAQYITAASFWGIDWENAIFYFGQIYNSVPNLRDSTGWTAVERYRLAYVFYGDALSKKSDYCKAAEMYQAALDLSADPAVEPTLMAVKELCEGPTNTPGKPTKTPTKPIGPTLTPETPIIPTEVTPDTPTWTPETPTEEPPSPTPTLTPEPPTPTPG